MWLELFTGDYASTTLGRDFVNELKNVDVHSLTMLTVHGLAFRFDGDEKAICHRCRRVKRPASPETDDFYVLLTNKRTIVVSPDGIVLFLPHCELKMLPLKPIPLEWADARFWAENLPIQPISLVADSTEYRAKLKLFMEQYPRDSK